jgi:hypothetical protein
MSEFELSNRMQLVLIGRLQRLAPAMACGEMHVDANTEREALLLAYVTSRIYRRTK